MNDDPRELTEPELAQVRAALRDVEPLDELTRRRMIARAAEAGPVERRAWWSGPAFRLAAAAAVLVVVVAAVVVAVRPDDDGEVALVDEGVIAGDLGALDDPLALRSALGLDFGLGDSAGAGIGGPAPGGTGPAGDTATGAPRAGRPGAVEPEAGDELAQRVAEAPRPLRPEDRRAIDRCAGGVPERDREGTTIALAGIGTFAGEDAVVLVYRLPTGTLRAWILARDACGILSSQLIR